MITIKIVGCKIASVENGIEDGNESCTKREYKRKIKRVWLICVGNLCIAKKNLLADTIQCRHIVKKIHYKNILYNY